MIGPAAPQRSSHERRYVMRIRMASFSWPIVALVSALAGAAPTAAQQPAGQVVKLGEGETLTIGGFISASFFNDRGVFGRFGQGQNAEWAAQVQPGVNQGFTDGDIRNTRINFTFNAGPVLGKWTPKGVIEADFFGAFNGAPPFGDEQPQLRGRLLYADLTNGRSTLRIGQYWSPLFAEVPVSLTHIAFPLGYGATGMIGWRFPGIFWYQDLSAAGKPMTMQLQVAVMKGSGPIAGLATAPDGVNNIGSGEASGKPQLEARLNVIHRGKLPWSVYVVGHANWKDTTGNGVGGSNNTGSGVELGGSVAPGHLTVHGNFYTGKGLGQQFAHITPNAGPTPPSPAIPTVAAQSRIKGLGAWAQVGYDFTPHWSLWLFYGLDQPKYGTFNTETGAVLPRQLNHDGDALIRFRAGRYAVGLEFFRAVTGWSTGVSSADQIALSALYTI